MRLDVFPFFRFDFFCGVGSLNISGGVIGISASSEDEEEDDNDDSDDAALGCSNVVSLMHCNRDGIDRTSLLIPRLVVGRESG